MGMVIPLVPRRQPRHSRRILSPRQELPLMLSKLLDAGAVDFARVALDAWGNQEMGPEELLDLCNTYASVAGLKTLA